MSLLSGFSHGVNMKGEIKTPFYARSRLLYPFLCDFYSSILVSAGGASFRVAFSVPTILLYISVYFSLRATAKVFTEIPGIPELSIFLYFSAAGDGWKYQINGDYIFDPNVNSVHCFGPSYGFWIHPLVHFLMPQRNGLLSLPICCYVLILFGQNPHFEYRNMILAGVLHGLLPMAAAHSFIAVGEYAIFFCLLFFPFKQIMKRQMFDYFYKWCAYGIPAIVIALPQILYLNPMGRSMLSFKAIWYETFPDPILSPIKTWWVSLGPFALISIFGVWAKLTSQQRQLYIPSMGVFIVSCLIMYQPGGMDNTKVFFVAWLPYACVCVSIFFLELLKSNTKLIFIVLPIFISMQLSSLICIFKAFLIPFPMFSPEQRDIGIWAMNSTRLFDSYLCSASHNNPIMSYAGRQVNMGYGGWIGSHGLNYNERAYQTYQLIDQRENIELFKSLNYLYAIVRPDDLNLGYNFSEPRPSSHWIKIFGFFGFYNV